MKKSLLIPAFLLMTGTLAAQKALPEKDAIHAGINVAFFTDGDIYMPDISIDYTHPLNKFMAISPKVIGAYHNKVRYGINRYSSSAAAALSLRINPLPGIFDQLKIDIGALYNHFKTSSLYIADPGISNAGNYDYHVDDLFGLIGSVSLDFPNKRIFFWGCRFDALTSFRGDYFNFDSWQFGIYGGMKF
jgi:hypothetical protein